MNTTRLAQARRLFDSPLTSREVNRANQRKWVRSIRFLGAKWLLALPYSRPYKQGENNA